MEQKLLKMEQNVKNGTNIKNVKNGTNIKNVKNGANIHDKLRYL